MAMVHTTQDALEQAILSDMQKAVDKTLIRLIEELKRFIQTELYDVYSPNWYERTFQVLDLWKANPSVITGKMVVGEIAPEYSTLKTNRSKGQHIITGETLIDMLMQGYGNQDKPYNSPRPFFDSFKEYVDANVERIFIEEMNGNTNNIGFSHSFS